MSRIGILAVLALALGAAGRPAAAQVAAGSYLDSSGRDDVLSDGVRMIPVKTPRGTFHVWTKRVGNSPTMKVLLLHGGPGITHEYFEAFDSYFPAAFYLVGQSWGGLLALEYALNYQQNLKGLVISNMMASIPAYNEYARNVLMPAMDPAALAEIKRLEEEERYEDPG